MYYNMGQAISEAKEAISNGEVPVGAVIVRDGVIIARAHNAVIKMCDPTAHAEILAIRDACKNIGQHRLDFCEMYVTLEPCAMCAQAISNARIMRLYYGAYDIKGGGVDHGGRIFAHSLHKPEIISGVCESDCAEILKFFFMDRRF